MSPARDADVLPSVSEPADHHGAARIAPQPLEEPYPDLHRAAVDALGEGVVITDRDGAVLTINAAAEEMIGISGTDALGQQMSTPESTSVVTETGEPVTDDSWPAHQVLRTGNPVSGTVLGFVQGEEPVRWNLVSSRPLRGPQSTELLGTVTSIVDITARKSLADAADHRSRHDPLTGLANRAELIRMVGSFATRTHRTGSKVAIAFCDIDNFKAVNDRFGHAAGDELLVVIAGRMAASVRAGDLVARVGGDELAVVLDGVDGIEDAMSVAHQIRASVGAPVTLRNGVVTPTLSIGVSMASPGQGPAETLHRADLAMYAAKRSGRDAVMSLDQQSGPIALENPDSAAFRAMREDGDARSRGL